MVIMSTKCLLKFHDNEDRKSLKVHYNVVNISFNFFTISEKKK